MVVIWIVAAAGHDRTQSLLHYQLDPLLSDRAS